MSEQSHDLLIEIPTESYSSLRDKFKVYWPKHIIVYTLFNTFSTQIDKNLRNRKDVTVFSLNDDWDDGTFIAMVKSLAKPLAV